MKLVNIVALHAFPRKHWIISSDTPRNWHFLFSMFFTIFNQEEFHPFDFFKTLTISAFLICPTISPLFILPIFYFTINFHLSFFIYSFSIKEFSLSVLDLPIIQIFTPSLFLPNNKPLLLPSRRSYQTTYLSQFDLSLHNQAEHNYLSSTKSCIFMSY